MELEAAGWARNMGDRHRHMELPPGFRFHPTDEELITHYLSKKAIDAGFRARAIAEADLNKCEPWDLPLKAKMGKNEWYFFCVRDRKYPTGLRTNRATEAGYWKATGKDKEIYRGSSLVGMKKTLVFYMGRAPRGEKTNWVMHEFRLEGYSSSIYNIPRVTKSEWVICRVFHKSPGEKRASGPFLPVLLREDGVARGRAPPDVTCFSSGMEGCYGHHPLLSCSEAAAANGATRVQLLEREMMSASQETGVTAADVNTAAAEISSSICVPQLMDSLIWACRSMDPLS